jgi:hypothetical protein
MTLLYGRQVRRSASYVPQRQQGQLTGRSGMPPSFSIEDC